MMKRNNFAAILGILLAFCAVMSASANPPKFFSQIPLFSLESENAKPFGLNDLKGKVWIADFIYTHCTDECPMLTAKMAKLQKTFQKFNDIRLVSVSIDPTHDTPKVLRDYASHYGADLNRWIFLTGDKKTIKELVQKGFHLPLITNPQQPGLIMAHSNFLVLVDQNEKIRGYYDSTNPEKMKELVHDAESLATQK